MRRSLRLTTVIALTLLVTTAAPGRATACPNCKEAVSAQPSELAGIARGYNYSVMFMVSMPFVMLGTGVLMVARAVRRGAMPEL